MTFKDAARRLISRLMLLATQSSISLSQKDNLSNAVGVTRRKPSSLTPGGRRDVAAGPELTNKENSALSSMSKDLHFLWSAASG